MGYPYPGESATAHRRPGGGSWCAPSSLQDRGPGGHMVTSDSLPSVPGFPATPALSNADRGSFRAQGRSGTAVMFSSKGPVTPGLWEPPGVVPKPCTLSAPPADWFQPCPPLYSSAVRSSSSSLLTSPSAGRRWLIGSQWTWGARQEGRGQRSTKSAALGGR